MADVRRELQEIAGTLNSSSCSPFTFAADSGMQSGGCEADMTYAGQAVPMACSDSR